MCDLGIFIVAFVLIAVQSKGPACQCIVIDIVSKSSKLSKVIVDVFRQDVCLVQFLKTLVLAFIGFLEAFIFKNSFGEFFGDSACNEN